MKIAQLLNRAKVICFIFLALIISNILYIAPAYATLPAAPSNLHITNQTGSQVTLAWQDNSTTESSFSLCRTDASGNCQGTLGSVGANVTTIQLNFPTFEGIIYVIVRAWDGGEYSVNSNVLSITFPLLTPTSLTAAASSSTAINLTWKDTSGTENNYVIERKYGSFDWSTLSTLAANSTSYTDSGLPYSGNITFYYRVKATTTNPAIPASGYSNTAQATTPTSSLTSLPSPKLLQYSSKLTGLSDLKMTGSKVYGFNNNSGLIGFDVSNPQNIQLLGTQFPPAYTSNGKLALIGTATAVLGPTIRGIDIVSLTPSPNYQVLSSVNESIVNDVASSGSFVYLATDSGIKVIDVTDPRSAYEMASLAIPAGKVTGLAVSGQYLSAIVNTGTAGELHMIKITDPSNLVDVGHLALGDGLPGLVASSAGRAIIDQPALKNQSGLITRYPRLLYINTATPQNPTKAGEYLYPNTLIHPLGSLVISGNQALYGLPGNSDGSPIGLFILNITNPGNITLAGQYLSSPDGQYTNPVSSIAASGNSAIIGLNYPNVIESLDISTPSQIKSLQRFNPSPDYSGLVTSNNTAIFYNATHAVVYNITDPLNPQKLANLPGANTIVYSGNTAVLLDTGFKLYDLTTPASPHPAGTLAISNPLSVTISQNLAFVTTKDILYIIDISVPANPVIKSQFAATSGPACYYPTYLGAISTYQKTALVSWGCSTLSGQAVAAYLEAINFTNPASPTFASVTQTTQVNDIKVVGNLAYLAESLFAGTVTVQIYDVANSANLVKKSQYDVFSLGDSTMIGCSASLAISNNIAYVPICPASPYLGDKKNSYAIMALDVSDPTAIKPLPSTVSYSPSLLASPTIVNGKLFGANDYMVYDLYSDTLKLTLTPNTYKVNRGDQITYTLTAENTSANVLSNIQITAPIPVSTQYVVGSASPAPTSCGPSACDLSATSLKWSVPLLIPGDKITFTYKVRVN